MPPSTSLRKSARRSPLSGGPPPAPTAGEHDRGKAENGRDASDRLPHAITPLSGRLQATGEGWQRQWSVRLGSPDSRCARVVVRARTDGQVEQRRARRIDRPEGPRSAPRSARRGPTPLCGSCGIVPDPEVSVAADLVHVLPDLARERGVADAGEHRALHLLEAVLLQRLLGPVGLRLDPGRVLACRA